MTKSIIISHNEGQTSTANSTQHFSLGGARGTAGFWDVAHTDITWNSVGTLSNLRIFVTVESLAANATFRTKKNGANGSQSVVFQTTGAFEDTTNTDSVAALDEFTLEAVGPASGTFLFTMAQCYFDYGSAGARNLLSPADATVDLASATRYGPIHGQPDPADWGATENTSIIAEQRTSMLFEDFQINRQDNSRTTTTTFRTRKNAANGAQSIAFTTGTGIVMDAVNSDGVIAGDNFNYQIITGTGVQALRFYPAIFAGANSSSISEYLVGRATGQARVGNIADHYEPIAGTLIPTAVTTEANVQVKVPDSVIWSELTVTITANSMDSGETNLFTFRKNSAATSMVVSNTFGQTGVISDSTNTASTIAGDLVCHQVNPAGAATDSVTIMSIAVWGTIDTSQDITRALPTETITLSDSRTRLAEKIRTRTDTAIAISETRARLSAKNRPIATQTIIIGVGVAARIKGKVKSLATETITVGGGTLTKLLAKIRTSSDTTVIAEARNRLAAKNRALATQTTTTSESIVRIKGKLKSLATETITIGAGTAARVSAKIRTISLQTISLTDNRTRLKGSMRTIATQTVTLSENIARVVARQVIRALATQTVALSESIARLKTSQRIISQTIVIADARNRLTAKLRALSVQTITLSDSRVRIKGAIKTISQTVLLSENIARRLVKLRVLAAQTVILADNVTRAIIGGAEEITRTLTQTVVLSETVGRRLAAQRILSQTVPIAENLARVRGVLRTLSQNIPVSESRSRIKSASKLISQTIPTFDSLSRLNALRRTVSQTTMIAENVVAETVGNLVRSLVETLTVSDSIARRTAKLVILAQTVIIVEQQARRLSTKLRIIPAQIISLSDSATQELNVIIKHVIKIIVQATTITDYAKIEVIKKSQRFRKILQPSIKRLISNHPAWLLGTRGMHNDYEEFSP